MMSADDDSEKFYGQNSRSVKDKKRSTTHTCELSLSAKDLDKKKHPQYLGITSLKVTTANLKGVEIIKENSNVNVTFFHKGKNSTITVGALTALDASGNSMTTFPSIANHPILEKLILSKNEISRIPNPLSDYNTLRTLNLSNNHVQTIPSSIAQLTKLLELDLSSNILTTLPDEIYTLTSLEKLNLQSNFLSEIDKKITNLVNLKAGKNGLNLRKNRLKIPPQIEANRGIICFQGSKRKIDFKVKKWYFIYLCDNYLE